MPNSDACSAATPRAYSITSSARASNVSEFACQRPRLFDRSASEAPFDNDVLSGSVAKRRETGKKRLGEYGVRSLPKRSIPIRLGAPEGGAA